MLTCGYSSSLIDLQLLSLISFHFYPNLFSICWRCDLSSDAFHHCQFPLHLPHLCSPTIQCNPEKRLHIIYKPGAPYTDQSVVILKHRLKHMSPVNHYPTQCHSNTYFVQWQAKSCSHNQWVLSFTQVFQSIHMCEGLLFTHAG